MKSFMITGIFFRAGRVTSAPSEICGALSEKYQDKVVSSKFTGSLVCAEDNTFKGEVMDLYGKATITGTMKSEGNLETISFRKTYEHLAGAINCQLAKKNGIYSGRFQVENYGRESEGWIKCHLTPVDDDFFQPEEFMAEINSEIERREL